MRDVSLPKIWCIWILFFITIFPGISQESLDLLFREDWKEIPAAIPVTQEHVNHPDLILHLYGPGQDSIKKSHHNQPADDPYYIWSGLCRANWAVALSHKTELIDLSGQAKIRWRAKQFGFRILYLIIKQHSGDWLIADQGNADSNDWQIHEFNIQELNWRRFNIETITEQHNHVLDPDLSSISEIGFTDLMIGGGSQACSRLDWIEVYAKGNEK